MSIVLRAVVIRLSESRFYLHFLQVLVTIFLTCMMGEGSRLDVNTPAKIKLYLRKQAYKLRSLDNAAEVQNGSTLPLKVAFIK